MHLWNESSTSKVPVVVDPSVVNDASVGNAESDERKDQDRFHIFLPDFA